MKVLLPGLLFIGVGLLGWYVFRTESIDADRGRAALQPLDSVPDPGSGASTRRTLRFPVEPGSEPPLDESDGGSLSEVEVQEMVPTEVAEDSRLARAARRGMDREQLPDSRFEAIYKGWEYEELDKRCGALYEKLQSEQTRLLEERYQAGLYTIIPPKTVVTGGNEVVQARSDWVDEPGGEKQYSVVHLPAEEYPDFYALWDEWSWLMKTTNKMADERIENVVDVRDL